MSTYYQLFTALLLFVYAVNAQAIQFSSGPRQVTLLELYTSEGCSSCPPAESYLNQFKTDKRLWKEIIPVAFHVDYWDYLGWQDRFARPDHRVRQEAYAAINRQSTIYTPAFFLNGKPWRRGLFGRDPGETDRQSGVLTIDYQAGQVNAHFKPMSELAQPLRLHTVILGLGFKSSIKAGENRGRHSEHEFVVLQQQSATSADGQWQIRINRHEVLAAGQYALAAWVTVADDPRPIQAAGGYLPSLE